MESSMKSMKTYLIVWLAGLVAGLALMQRWQRTSGLQAPAAGDAGETVDADAAAMAPADQPRGAAVIVSGAKADAERARQMLVRMAPWASSAAPTPAQPRRAGRTAPPEATPTDPA
jgi:hypothetical protein